MKSPPPRTVNRLPSFRDPGSAFRLVLTLLSAVVLCACDSDREEAAAASAPAAAAQVDPQRRVMAQVLDQKAKAQAAGLGKGRLTVNGAWNYSGYSLLSPLPEARLVAVDVTVSGHTPNFDFDDIEIVDAQRGISYGSDPQLELLNAEGRLETDVSRMPIAPATTRLLLIYGFPRDRDRFDLVYWHKKLNARPVTIAASGWEVPYPPKTEGSSASAPVPPVDQASIPSPVAQ